MNGRFTAVVHGEFQTASRLPVTLVAVCTAVVALVSWLATVLIELAVTAGALGLAIAGACWLLCRRNDRDAELLAERATALHQVTAQELPARPQEIHYHVHLAPGATAEDIRQALPPGGITATEQE